MAWRNAKTKNGYQKPSSSKLQPWFIDLLIHRENWPPPDDEFLTEPRTVVIDEQELSKIWNLDRLLRLSEIDEEENPSSKYLLTYASDSQYSIRTLISKQILGFIPSIASTNAEPPLTYSDAAVEESIDQHRKFYLLVTKYRFRMKESENLGITLSLIIEEGTRLENRSIDHTKSTPSDRFRKLCLENPDLYKILKKRFSTIWASWELKERLLGSDTPGTIDLVSQVVSNGDGAGSVMIISQNGPESNGNTSGMLSALIAGTVGSSNNGSSEVIVTVRHARIQTDPKITKWETKMNLQEAAASPQLIDLATPEQSTDSLEEIVDILRTEDGGPLADKRSGNEIGAQTDQDAPAQAAEGEGEGTSTTPPKKKKTRRPKLTDDLQEAFRDFRLPAATKRRCMELFMEK